MVERITPGNLLKYPDNIELYLAPPIWEDFTFVIIGCGPSLTPEQTKYIQESECRTIAINSSYLLAPWADILYAGDAVFWKYYKANLPEFCGVRVGMAWDAIEGKLLKGWKDINQSDARFMARTGFTGLESDPHGLKDGKNSGYAAINLAVHMGAKRIVLVGYDMKSNGFQHEFKGSKPGRSGPLPYRLFLEAFETIVEPLKALEVEVINCTPDSALDVFPKGELERYL